MNEFSRRDLVVASRLYLQVFAERGMYLMIPDYEHYEFVNLMGAYLAGLLEGAPSRLIINLPPRHGKTVYCAALGAYFLGKYPDKEMLVVSHSQTLAKDLSQKTFDLMETEFYKEVFPNTQIRSDRRAVSDFRTTAGGGRLGVSFDTSVTGRGADLIVLDDPLSAHDAGSVAEREALQLSFDGMIATRMNNPATGKILLVAHRLHPDDLTAHLLEKGYSHLSLAFEAQDDETHEFGGVTFSRSRGELLQPSRFPEQVLARLKAETPPHIYATQFLQQPTAAGRGLIRREDFPLIEVLPPRGRIVVSWDTASSTKPKSSHSVALVFQQLEDVSYLRQIFRRQVAYEDLRGAALDLHDRLKPAVHLIEAAALGEALIADLRRIGANVLDIKPAGASKLARLEAQMHHIKGQRVQILRNMPGFGVLP